ncbi:hypothetical protein IFM89_008378 [Coptis chinensis]|uniref:Uncharacterized protein n=1 Tax=Coptis chinensis TaxID=261450 RepID=A0A835IL03_9MAGN|nr:hypothetical protein IFM89_008378 [Coptis chinensis]
MANSASRQIYLTFRWTKTFERRRRLQLLQTWGLKVLLVSFPSIYYKTVKLILAKGNPHFVCDARVLVKPYKEKGKVPDSPRMLYNTNELFMRTKLEQAELQQAMELHSRKPMGCDLLMIIVKWLYATSLSLSTIDDNVSKPQAELDHGDKDTEESSKHGDNNTHVRVLIIF